MQIQSGQPTFTAAQTTSSTSNTATTAPAPAAAESDALTTTVKPEGKQPGVIRNLLSGHYKGVADVRLRIVHAEKLAALQAEASAAALSGAADTLANALQPTLDDFAAELAAIAATAAEEGGGEEDEAPVETNPLADFRASLAALLDSGADPASFGSGAESAFQTLIDQLGLAPVEVAATTTDASEGEVEGEAGIGEGNSVEATAVETTGEEEAGTEVPRDYLSELTQVFQQALAELLTAAETSILPPLSEPNGNGVAYDKFLSQYLSLQETTAEPPADGSEVRTETGDAAGVDIEV